MSRETSLWQWFKRAYIPLGPRLHMTRIENMVSAGAPDVEGQLRDRGQFWIELKVCPRPAKAGKLDIKTRPAQVFWLRKRWATGGAAFLLIQVGSGWDARYYLIPGDDAATVHAGVTEEDLRLLAVGIWSATRRDMAGAGPRYLLHQAFVHRPAAPSDPEDAY